MLIAPLLVSRFLPSLHQLGCKWVAGVYSRRHIPVIFIDMSAVANPESGLDADERIAIVNESNNEVTGSARRAEMVSLYHMMCRAQSHTRRPPGVLLAVSLYHSGQQWV